MQENTNYHKNLQSLALPEDTWLYLQHLDSIYIFDPSNEDDNFELTAFNSSASTQTSSDDLPLYKMLDLVYVYNPSNVYDRYPKTSAVVYDIIPTGGLVAGGNPLASITYVNTPTGGLLAGGVGLVGSVYSIASTGGSLASGVASQTITYNEIPTGGLLAGGVGSIPTVHSIASTGGSLAGGVGLVASVYNHNLVLVDPSDEVWLSNHLGLIYIYDNINHDDEFETISYASRFFTLGYSGSVLAGGSSVVARVREHVPTGGSLAGGVGSQTITYNETPTGGSLAGGVASQTITYNITPTGGSRAGGVGLQSFSDVVEVSGGSLAGGIGLETAVYNIVSNNGSLAGGVGLETAVYNIVSNNGLLAGGVGLETFSDVVEVSGGSLAGGVGLETAVYNIVSNNGSLAGGVGLETAVYDIVSTGGSFTGGVGLETAVYSIDTIGGLLVNIVKNIDGTLDSSFYTGTGFDNEVWSIAIQGDEKILCGGFFTSYNGATRNSIVRLNSNGTLDSSFNIGTGFNSPVLSIAIQSDGKILCGGPYTSYNGATRNRIVRLNSNGSLDSSFNVGTGFNAQVLSIVIQSDGKILCGGTFTSYNGRTQNRIVRLNSNGTLDSSFNVGTGFNEQVFDIAIQSDGKILCLGTFTSYNGATRNRIVRLNSDGSLDNSFFVGVGFDGPAASVEVQSDGRILCGGNFTSYNGTNQSGIVRLNSDGTLDSSLSVGTGFNFYIWSIAIQNDSKILCGGSFRNYNGTSQNRIVRLNSNGTLDSSFNIGTGFNSPVLSTAIQKNGNILCGGIFTSYNETIQNRISRLNSTNATLSPNDTVIYNATATGGLLAGGLGLETFNDIVEVSGGSLAGGVGLETAFYTIVSTGGSLAGGVGLETFSDVVEVSGGSLVGGIALESAVYNIAATGGSLAGGAGSETAVYNIVSTGGSLAGGVGLETAVCTIVSTGGSLAGGAGLETAVYTIVSTGGSLASSTSEIELEYNLISMGGVINNGFSLSYFDYNLVSSLDLTANGSAVVDLIFLASGGLIVSPFSLLRQDILTFGGVKVSISSIVSMDFYNFLRDIKYSFEIGQKVYSISNNLSPQKTTISRIILENNVFRYVTPLGDFYSNEISPIEEKDKVLNLNIDNIDSNLKTIESNTSPPLSQGGVVKFADTTQQKDKILNISDKINNLNKHKKPPNPKGGKFVLTLNNSNNLITNNREKIMKKIKQLSGG